MRNKVVNQSGHTIPILQKEARAQQSALREIWQKAKTRQVPVKCQNRIKRQTRKKQAKEIKRNQKKRGLEEQDLGEPKSKIVNKFKNTEEPEDEEERDQREDAPNKTAVQKEEIESNPQTDEKRDEEEAQIEELICELPKLPVKGTVKWEKPDRWENNVMITKIEQDSHDDEEESLPIVFEIKPPAGSRKSEENF